MSDAPVSSANEPFLRLGNGALHCLFNVPVASAIGIACTRDPRCTPGILQTLVFKVPSLLIPLCYYAQPRCLMPLRKTKPGDYQVSVENVNGLSNRIVFKVTRF